MYSKDLKRKIKLKEAYDREFQIYEHQFSPENNSCNIPLEFYKKNFEELRELKRSLGIDDNYAFDEFKHEENYDNFLRYKNFVQLLNTPFSSDDRSSVNAPCYSYLSYLMQGRLTTNNTPTLLPNENQQIPESSGESNGFFANIWGNIKFAFNWIKEKAVSGAKGMWGWVKSLFSKGTSLNNQSEPSPRDSANEQFSSFVPLEPESDRYLYYKLLDRVFDESFSLYSAKYELLYDKTLTPEAYKAKKNKFKQDLENFKKNFHISIDGDSITNDVIDKLKYHPNYNRIRRYKRKIEEFPLLKAYIALYRVYSARFKMVIADKSNKKLSLIEQSKLLNSLKENSKIFERLKCKLEIDKYYSFDEFKNRGSYTRFIKLRNLFKEVDEGTGVNMTLSELEDYLKGECLTPNNFSDSASTGLADVSPQESSTSTLLNTISNTESAEQNSPITSPHDSDNVITSNELDSSEDTGNIQAEIVEESKQDDIANPTDTNLVSHTKCDGNDDVDLVQSPDEPDLDFCPQDAMYFNEEEISDPPPVPAILPLAVRIRNNASRMTGAEMKKIVIEDKELNYVIKEIIKYTDDDIIKQIFDNFIERTDLIDRIDKGEDNKALNNDIIKTCEDCGITIPWYVPNKIVAAAIKRIIKSAIRTLS